MENQQRSFHERNGGVADNLKIRASYGEVGNDVYKVNGVKQRFLYQAVWTQIANDYHFGTTGYTGIYESQYPNLQ